MTEGSAVSCASCGTAVRAGTTVCPRCAAPVAPPLTELPLLLDGCVPAGAGARAGARTLDVLLVLLPVGVGAAAAAVVPDARGAALALGVVVAAVVAAALVSGYGRTGRTPGHVVTGTRGVDVVTGLVPRTAGGPSRWRGDTVVLDVRTGRDPVTTPAVQGAAFAPLQAPAAVTAGYHAAAAAQPGPGRHAAPPASAGPLGGPAPTVTTGPPAAQPVAPPPHLASPYPGTQHPAAQHPAQHTSGPRYPAQHTPDPQHARPQHARPQPPTPVPPAPLPAPLQVAVPPAAPPPHAAPQAPSGTQVRLDDGRSVVVSGVTLVGRNPAPAPGDVQVELLPLPDLTRSVSKTHAVLRWDGRDLRVTDRGSTNGTLLETPGDRLLLPAGVETVAPVGSRIVLGDRVLTVEGIVT